MKPHFLLVSLLMAGALFCAPAFALPRVASLSVCADQYVLALADPAQVAALSMESTDPVLSFFAEKARGFAQVGPHAEEILALHPDIAITDSYGDASTVRLLARMGVRPLYVPDVNSFDALEEAMRIVGAGLGRPDAGTALAAQLSARRAALAALIPENPPPALYLLPTGGTAGTGTYIDETLRLAGFSNDATRRGITGWKRLSLETLIADPPPRVIVSFFMDALPSTGTILGPNPATARIAALKHPIGVPNAYWPCAGPMLIDAAELLRRRRMEQAP